MEYRLQPWVSWSFLQNNDHQQLRRWNKLKIEKYEKIQTKTVGISFIYGCKCVSVCGCVGMCYSYIWMRDFMRLSQATNAVRWESGNEFEYILIIRYIILFLCL